MTRMQQAPTLRSRVATTTTLTLHDDGRPRIAFIGAGRVGTALGAAFARAGWQVTAVASRDPDRRARFRELVPAARALLRAARPSSTRPT